MFSLESHAELQDQRIQGLEERCAALANKLIARVADLENRSPRNNIRIISLSESKEGPRPTGFFTNQRAEENGTQILQFLPELDRAHRALTAKPQSGSQQRPVILRLHCYQIKDLIIREPPKEPREISIPRDINTFLEDYTPEVAKQQAKYKQSWLTSTNWDFDQCFFSQPVYRSTWRMERRGDFGNPRKLLLPTAETSARIAWGRGRSNV